jgi:ferredoxin
VTSGRYRSPMRIRIDGDTCTGHGRCYTLAPELVTADDEGFGQVTQGEVPPDHEAAARRATASCPEGAVHLDG